MAWKIIEIPRNTESFLGVRLFNKRWSDKQIWGSLDLVVAKLGEEGAKAEIARSRYRHTPSEDYRGLIWVEEKEKKENEFGPISL